MVIVLGLPKSGVYLVSCLLQDIGMDFGLTQNVAGWENRGFDHIVMHNALLQNSRKSWKDMYRVLDQFIEAKKPWAVNDSLLLPHLQRVVDYVRPRDAISIVSVTRCASANLKDFQAARGSDFNCEEYLNAFKRGIVTFLSNNKEIPRLDVEFEKIPRDPRRFLGRISKFVGLPLTDAAIRSTMRDHPNHRVGIYTRATLPHPITGATFARDCVHLEKVVRTDTCELCGTVYGHKGVKVEVRACSVFGECSAARYKSGKSPHVCNSAVCSGYQAKNLQENLSK